MAIGLTELNADDVGVPQGDRQRRLARLHALRTERSSWDEQWRDIAKHMLPRAGRWFTTDVNDGKKKGQSIYDETAQFALRTLGAGMMSGVTSPARPWFRLALEDKDLAEHGPVKRWLHDCATLLRSVFAKSNTYNALHQGYVELGAFGTFADVVLPDFDDVICHYPMTVGEYYLGHDARGRVDTMFREFRMTVGQMVQQFGKNACSRVVRDLYDAGRYDTWVDVVHCVQPRRSRNARSEMGKDMPWESVYFEPARADGLDAPLSESGFRRFPVLASRWTVVGNDVYGASPGMDALGSTKQLQFEQLKKAQAIALQVDPPLQVPTAYKDAAVSRLPGGVMYVDAMSPGGGIRSAYEVNLRLDYLMASIEDTRQRIRQGFYADLFLMLAQQPAGGKMTATEVAERHEEKLLMLGPVLERLHNELLSPLIDITFDRCLAAGVLPPVPQELQERGISEIGVEFVSVLAQAQRAVAVNGMERLLANAGGLAQLWPEVRHKINAQQVIDDFADAFGVNPRIVRSDDDAQALVDAERQAAQAAQTAAAAPQVVESAKTASEVDMDGLRDVMSSLQGYMSPAAYQQ